jgi:hypothetical protein
LALRKKWPQTLHEVDLRGRIKAATGGSLAEAGEFFGWQRRIITKSIADFTKDKLLQRGWTKVRLLDIADGYDQIARITPNNPSARQRARQLRELAQLLD